VAGAGGRVDVGLSCDYGANRVYKNVAQRVLHCMECDNYSKLNLASTTLDFCWWSQIRFADRRIDVKY
jgi:hypothetical protein